MIQLLIIIDATEREFSVDEFKNDIETLFVDTDWKWSITECKTPEV